MSQYSAPTNTQIANWTGVSAAIKGQTDAAFEALLTELKGYAASRVALEVTSGTFTSSSLTADQVNALQQAVACQTAILYLRAPAVQDATGTQEPLLMSSEEITAMKDELAAEVATWCSLVANGEGAIRITVETTFDDDTEDTRIFSREMSW